MDYIGVLILDLSDPSDPSGPKRTLQTQADPLGPLGPKLAFWACRGGCGGMGSPPL